MNRRFCGPGRASGRPSRRVDEAGVALVVVISALVMLLVLAIPFVMTGRKDFRVATQAAAKMRARAVADTAFEWAEYELGSTHRGVEVQGEGWKTPHYDTAEEWRIDPHPDAFAALVVDPNGNHKPYKRDPRGDLWTVKVADEQSKISLDTAPPFLLGATFGRTTLAEDYAPGNDYLVVADAGAFPAEGGELVIGAETTTYARIRESRIEGVKLLGAYGRETYVLSKAAFDVASYDWRYPKLGGYGGFGTLSSLKNVARYSRYAVAEERLAPTLEPYTVYGQRPTVEGWLGPQRVTQVVSPTQFQIGKGQPVAVRNPDYFNPGTIVRIGDGQTWEWNVVVRSLRRDQEGVLYLLEPTAREYALDTAVIAAEMRQPVNINGCSRAVLVSLLTGLEFNTNTGAKPDPAKRVSPEMAAVVAALIEKNRPIRGTEHLSELLKTLFHVLQNGAAPGYEGAAGAETLPADFKDATGFALDHALAILQNAINPCHRGLLQSTMPFCYTSGDWFTIETAASVNDAAGTELARHRARETVRTAPARPLAARLDSQFDFEESILAGRQSRFIETHPNPQSWYTGFFAKPETRLFRYLTNFRNNSKRGFFPDATKGDVRLQPARLTTPVNGDYEEHFDGDADEAGQRSGRRQRSRIPTEYIGPEGYSLVAGPFDLPLNQGRGGQGGRSNPNSGAVVDDFGLLPFALEVFMKPGSFQAGPHFFSMIGDDPDQDYARCWYEPSDRSIHLKVHDIAIDPPGSTFERAAEVVWTPQSNSLEDDTWFHIGAHVGGTRPEQLSLHVDGWKRGESKFKSNLTGSMTDNDTTFEVEDSNGWPDFGPVWIGPEVVEAERLSGNRFRVFDWTTQSVAGSVPYGRGQRGTGAYRKGHPSGESVSLFGYSALLTTSVLNAGVGTSAQSTTCLTEGGGKLASDLAPYNVAAVVGNASQSFTIGAVSFTVEYYDPSLNPDITLTAWAGANVNDVVAAFQQSGGYAVLVTFNPLRAQLGQGAGGPGGQQGPVVVELVKYASRQNNVLTGVAAVPNPPNAALAGNPTLNINLPGGLQLGTGIRLSTTRIPHDTKNLSGGPNGPMYTAIFPISVHLTTISGYREPDPSIAVAGATGNVTTEPEFIQLGQPNAVPSNTNASTHRVEWIRYHHVDRQAQMLLCDEKSAIEREVALAITGISNGNPAIQLVSNGLGMRYQLGTSRFGYQTPGQARDVHTRSEDVIPVFRTVAMPTNAATFVERTPAGYGDSVTLISDLDKVKAPFWVAWAEDEFVAFTQNVPKRIRQRGLTAQAGQGGQGQGQADRRMYSRICKFPSGELPLVTNRGQGWIGADSQGAVHGGGTIDEIRMRGLAPERYVLWDHARLNPTGSSLPNPLPIGISANDDTIPLVQAEYPIRPFLRANIHWLPDGRELAYTQQPTNLPTDAGLVLIDDEVIAYRGVGSTGQGAFTLENCIRGFMNTTPTPHSFASNVVLLDWRAVTTLAGQLDAENPDLAVTSENGFNPYGGAVLVNQEMIHYVRSWQGALAMPRAEDASGSRPQGLFRGRYGTRAAEHTADDIVLDMPFRYWDRYAPASDDPDLAFYEFSLNQRGSFFGAVRWTHVFPKPHLNMRVLCRLDPRESWSTAPDASGGKLRVFDSKPGQQSQAQENKGAIGVNGEGMDVRVFFLYEPNAFDATDLRANGWKETPRLEAFQVDYASSPWVVIRETLP